MALVPSVASSGHLYALSLSLSLQVIVRETPEGVPGVFKLLGGSWEPSPWLTLVDSTALLTPHIT